MLVDNGDGTFSIKPSYSFDKQEPVAWMLNGKLHDCDPSDWAKEQYPDQDVIPLYTAPRELSDDEIISCMGMEMKTLREEALVFARAILKKASEK